MKIAYLYDRPVSTASEWDVDQIYADAKDTQRAERADMLAYGLRSGDTLLLASRSDIGRGREVTAILERVESMGVTVTIKDMPGDAPPKGKPGRAPRLDPPPEVADVICGLWRSGLEQSYVLRRAAEKVGVDEVTRNQMNRLCGPRHKKQKKSKEQSD